MSTTNVAAVVVWVHCCCWRTISVSVVWVAAALSSRSRTIDTTDTAVAATSSSISHHLRRSSSKCRSSGRQYVVVLLTFDLLLLLLFLFVGVFVFLGGALDGIWLVLVCVFPPRPAHHHPWWCTSCRIIRGTFAYTTRPSMAMARRQKVRFPKNHNNRKNF